MKPEALSLSGEGTVLLESLLHEGEVRSLEEGGGRSDGVARVGDDDIEGVLDGGEVLESVGDLDGDSGVGEDVGHAGEEHLGDSGDGLVNVDKDDLVDRGVLEDLSDDSSITSSDDEDLLGVGVRGKGDVSNHLLVPEVEGKQKIRRGSQQAETEESERTRTRLARWPG